MRFLFVDRILELVEGKLTRGIKHVTADDFYLTKDRDESLCFMPSLIGETLGQLAAWNAMKSCDFSLRPVAGVTKQAELLRPAYLGDTLLLESVIEKLDDSAVQYNSVAKINDEVVFKLDGALGPMLPMTDFIDTDVVKRQFNDLYRPGEWDEIPAKVFAKPQKLCPPMQFDALLEHEVGDSMTAIKTVTATAPYFPDHFPLNPVLPLTVLLECKLNLAREFVKDAPFDDAYDVRVFRKIKMSSFVRSGDEVVTTLKVKQFDDNGLILSFRSEVDGKRVCVLEMLMSKR